MITINQLKRLLNKGVYDDILEKLYFCGGEAIGRYRERFERLAQRYQEVFGRADEDRVAIFSAPGRTELGGNHTDHQRGKVLTGSVDLDAVACAAPNGLDTIRVFSEGYGMTEVELVDYLPHEEEKESTKALIRGVAAAIAEHDCPVFGFDAYVVSDVPGGSGLSSSACFEVLMGAIINGLFCGGILPPDLIAKAGQRAENEFFGKPSGLLDQMGCAMGGVVAIDFADADNPDFRAMKADFADYSLCIIDTGADHAGLTEEYAAVPKEMKAVAAFFGKEVLREVEEEEFYAAIPKLREAVGDRAVLRAIHFFADCRRVEAQTKALEEGDITAFLKLVSESGRSSYMYLQNIFTLMNSCTQPVAVALAVADHLLDGEGAFRVHGGGFAGTIQAFVPQGKLAEFIAGMDRLLGEGACRVTHIRPVGCCTLIE